MPRPCHRPSTRMFGRVCSAMMLCESGLTRQASRPCPGDFAWRGIKLQVPSIRISFAFARVLQFRSLLESLRCRRGMRCVFQKATFSSLHRILTRGRWPTSPRRALRPTPCLPRWSSRSVRRIERGRPPVRASRVSTLTIPWRTERSLWLLLLRFSSWSTKSRPASLYMYIMVTMSRGTTRLVRVSRDGFLSRRRTRKGSSQRGLGRRLVRPLFSTVSLCRWRPRENGNPTCTLGRPTPHILSLNSFVHDLAWTRGLLRAWEA